jgi:hypothetical protein
MRRIKNYTEFQRQKKINEQKLVKEEFEAVYRAAETTQQVFQEVSQKTAETSGNWGYAIAAGLVAGVGVLAWKGYKYLTGGDEPKKGGPVTANVAMGETSKTLCYNATLSKFGLKFGVSDRYFTASMKDVIDAIKAGDEKLIFKNWKPVKTSDVGIKPTNFDGTQDLTDLFRVDAKEIIDEGSLTFDLTDPTLKIVASGNGLLALSRLIRAAIANKDKQFTTGTVSFKIPEREGETLSFSVNPNSILPNLSTTYLLLDLYSYKNLDDFVNKWRTTAGSSKVGGSSMNSQEGFQNWKNQKPEVWFKQMIDNSSINILTSSMSQESFNKYLQDLFKSKVDIKQIVNDIKTQQVTTFYGLVPKELYGNDIKNFPAYFDELAKKLDLKMMSDSDIESYLKDARTSGKASKDIIDVILSDYGSNFEKIAKNFLCEKEAIRVTKEVKEIIGSADYKKLVQGKCSNFSQIKTGEKLSTKSADIKKTTTPHGEGQ